MWNCVSTHQPLRCRLQETCDRKAIVCRQLQLRCFAPSWLLSICEHVSLILSMLTLSDPSEERAQKLKLMKPRVTRLAVVFSDVACSVAIVASPRHYRIHCVV